MTEKRDEYDSPWKQLLERFFPEFMAFFFPDADNECKAGTYCIAVKNVDNDGLESVEAVQLKINGKIDWAGEQV